MKNPTFFSSKNPVFWSKTPRFFHQKPHVFSSNKHSFFIESPCFSIKTPRFLQTHIIMYIPTCGTHTIEYSRPKVSLGVLKGSQRGLGLEYSTVWVAKRFSLWSIHKTYVCFTLATYTLEYSRPKPLWRPLRTPKETLGLEYSIVWVPKQGMLWRRFFIDNPRFFHRKPPLFSSNTLAFSSKAPAEKSWGFR